EGRDASERMAVAVVGRWPFGREDIDRRVVVTDALLQKREPGDPNIDAVGRAEEAGLVDHRATKELSQRWPSRRTTTPSLFRIPSAFNQWPTAPAVHGRRYRPCRTLATALPS